MAQEIDIQRLSLSGIAHRCAKETELFFARMRHDPRPCFELFRRAMVDGCQRAWDLVYVQYHALVTSWVQRHHSFLACGEEATFLVNRAFEKMWSAMTPEKFSRFPDLKSVLRYLQMCAYSAVVDAARKAGPPSADVEAETLPVGGAPGGRPVDDHAISQVHRREFWEAIVSRLNDDQERCVVYGSYVLGLKPRELLDEYPDTFDDVRAVYRVKENILARLRRDEALHALLRGHA
jgi:DNA-directed RNA polymerase specialized sigma24 family protein